MYRIKDGCPNCGRCKDVCPVSAIKVNDKTVIDNNCISCGVCVNACPVRLIERCENNKADIKKTSKKEE